MSPAVYNRSTGPKSLKKIDGISANSTKNLQYIEEIFSESDVAGVSCK